MQSSTEGISPSSSSGSLAQSNLVAEMAIFNDYLHSAEDTASLQNRSGTGGGTENIYTILRTIY